MNDTSKNKGVGTRCKIKGCLKYKDINENGICPKHVALNQKLATSSEIPIYKCGTLARIVIAVFCVRAVIRGFIIHVLISTKKLMLLFLRIQD